MKTLVIGGSGFLGSYIVEALRSANQQVAVLSRNPDSAAASLPADVAVLPGDLGELDKAQFAELLAPFDGLVYAAGADERTPPEGDPRDFYFHENVDTCRKVLIAAAEAGLSHCVILNSIFTHLNRSQPQLELAKHHPYIASRIAQSEMAIDVAKGHFTLTVLEVPWVFGDSRGRASQWAPLVHYARSVSPLFCPRGGAIAISAENIGRASLGALLRPHNAEALSLPLGDCTLSWDEMIAQLAAASGRRNVHIRRLPDLMLQAANTSGALALAVTGNTGGLDFARMHEFLLLQLDADLDHSRELLDYERSDIRHALAATVASVPEPAIARSWRQQVLNRRLRLPIIGRLQHSEATALAS
ncbi:MAG: NAD(P)-dependent oxidoreductase [Gammaproteobacteria bacterium]|nr:NAD(P)-dependent oxidoreductase [Gammaproteobacteria bacterium]MBT8150446.1 NAD(P)-dependent oxidoreductase [Gammaproteobacteria bacterium]NND38628.1 NAD(P)-dependent oxidoreductase [Pseudomonadales bacterium]NNM11316.1 NAD(P)-dependent oxidoreductase [Pseudomonadales bacterium]RZV56168.1 MAG: NAD(P)-dependent oxidoreductase [Pseudomonadales bacterium]